MCNGDHSRLFQFCGDVQPAPEGFEVMGYDKFGNPLNEMGCAPALQRDIDALAEAHDEFMRTCPHRFICNTDQQQCMEDADHRSGKSHICKRCGISQLEAKKYAPVWEKFADRYDVCGSIYTKYPSRNVYLSDILKAFYDELKLNNEV